MKTNWSRSMAFIVIALFLSPVQAVEDRTFFWEVRSDSTQVYLFGSIHFANTSFYPLRREILSAFDVSDALMLEIDVSDVDPQLTQQLLMNKGSYQDGSTIGDHLSPEAFAKLQAVLGQFRIPPSSVERFRPGVLSMLLGASVIQGLGYSPELGIDMHMARRAIAQKKPILELESLEQQFDMLVELPEADDFLSHSLEEFEDAREGMDEMERAWKKGDAGVILDEFITRPVSAYPGYARVIDHILYRRNDEMVRKIAKELRSDRVVFVVVGAAHLLGDRGIIRALERSGYEVIRR